MSVTDRACARSAPDMIVADLGRSAKNKMPQLYKSGEEVRHGDRVRCKDDEGKVIALESELPKWGLTPAKSKGMVMIEYKKMRLIAEYTESNEDLDFIGRAES